jgi:trimeric autotransporter adhesin
MKNSIFLMLFGMLISTNQIFAQNFKVLEGANSVTITPSKVSANHVVFNGNVVIGDSVLASKNQGLRNTGLGNGVLMKIDSISYTDNNGFVITKILGNDNVAVGYHSLLNNLLARNNTAIGSYALQSHQGGWGLNHHIFYSGGHNNTAIGYNALASDKNGSNNVAIGVSALRSNDGAIDYLSYGGGLYGYANVAVGTGSLSNNVGGSKNVAVGENALSSLEATPVFGSSIGGDGNTAIGASSGLAIITHSKNTFLGSGADATGDYTNSTAIGANAQVTSSNKVRIGDTQVSVIEGQVAWSYPSDRRLKENIVYTTRLGLDFINHLQTVSYNYIADKNKTRYDGFIAQDIEQTMKNMDVPFSGLKKSDDGMYSLAYSDFVMPLVNAVKEQQQQINDLKKQIEALKNLVLQVQKSRSHRIL